MPNVLIAYGPALGASIGYFNWNRSNLAAAVGAVAGYFLFPLAEIGALLVPIPYAMALPAALGGAIAASGFYGNSSLESLGIGAAVGAGSYVALAEASGLKLSQIEHPLNGFKPGQ